MLRQAQKGEISVPDEKIKELKERAKELRKTAVTMIYEAQSGHPGGSLSAADIVAALYFSEMHVDPKDPKWPDRDRFVLSKGHVCPIQYAALGKLGFFPEEDLHTLRQEGSKLQGHPSMLKCPGIDISTGSLGQGTACAVGMALAGKRDGRDYRVFDMVGDGELDEGHDMGQIVEVFDKIRAAKNGKPKFINAHTVKGKGVDYMENNLDWHGNAPNKEQYESAMAQLERGLN